ncbi:MAG: radical SAM protein [Bryobacteraceae bacterium]
MNFPILHTEARSILSRTNGFIAEAGFTHSLTPARNCTFGCTYCYVPTLGIYGGLKPEDWQRWGQFTTFKNNAAALLSRALRNNQVIYCSPLVDPYQPAEETEKAMPPILDALIANPPAVFTIQTRGPLILRDLERLQTLTGRTRLRVSFSLTTDDDQVRRHYEPHCAPLEMRLQTIRELRAGGIDTYATLAPLLPCNPEKLAEAAMEATVNPLIGDPLHVRRTKRTGATTREAAYRISRVQHHEQWLEPEFQSQIVERIRTVANAAGRRFATGPEAFSWLAWN